jgi:hypothetical protein
MRLPRRRLATLGYEPVVSTPEQCAALRAVNSNNSSYIVRVSPKECTSQLIAEYNGKKRKGEYFTMRFSHLIDNMAKIGNGVTPRTMDNNAITMSRRPVPNSRWKIVHGSKRKTRRGFPVGRSHLSKMSVLS